MIYFLQDDVPDSSNLLHFRKALTKMTSKGGSFGGDYSGVPRLRTGSRPPHRAYIATDITKHMALEDCTYGGIFALASTLFTANRYQSKPEPLTLLGLGRALVDTCHRAASGTSTGLPPETFYFDVPGVVGKNENDGGGSSNSGGGNSIIGTGGYALTPYLAQTYYLLHRVTGDEAYRRMAWELVVAIEKFCKVVGTEGGDERGVGYSSVKSVNIEEQSGEPPEHLDVMPPAFLGATLKYLYLIFADDDAAGDEKKNFRFPVDQWVFAMIALVLVLGMNLLSVTVFGELEFWFALVKVVIIIGFIALGVLAILGILPTSDVSGVHGLTDHGFFGGGVGGIFAAMAPNVMRSSVDPAYSLTIHQAASADTTLLIMTVAAAVFVPGVLAYTIWSYKVFASRISVESINPDQGGLHPTLVRDSAQPEAAIGY